MEDSTTAKIDKLTDEQKVLLEEFREKWRKIGLAPGAANLDIVAPIIRQFYKRIDKECPIIVQATSPMVAEIMLNAMDYMQKHDTDLTAADMDLGIPQVLQVVLADTAWWDNLRSRCEPKVVEKLHRRVAAAAAK